MDRLRALIGSLAAVLIYAVSACSAAPPPISPSLAVGYPTVDPCPSSEFWVPFAPTTVGPILSLLPELTIVWSRSETRRQLFTVCFHLRGTPQSLALAPRGLELADFLSALADPGRHLSRLLLIR
jgi:hypothetical protein